jgi:uncharacterized membrane protein
LRRSLLLALFASAAFVQSAQAQLGPGQSFEITQTIPVRDASGSPPGAWSWTLTGVNSSGLVVGGVETQTHPVAPYAWSVAGGAVPLGLPQGHTGGRAVAVNSQGWIAGSSFSEMGTATPTLWRNGTTTTITVPGEVDSEVTALGNGGHVAGITGLNRPNALRGFVWNDGEFTFLSSLGMGGSGQAIASGITNTGVAVGYSETAPGVGTATKWVNGTPESLGIDGGFSVARDVTDAGNIIVGSTDSRSFIIRDGEIEYLAPPPGASAIQARAVNEIGDVVGTIFYQDPNNRNEAFLYRNGQLFMGDDLLDVPGVIQTQGLGVTDDGRVFVIGFDRQFRPNVYELTFVDNEGPPPGEEPPPSGGNPPGVPEPTTALLLGIAGLGAAGWRRLRR